MFYGVNEEFAKQDVAQNYLLKEELGNENTMSTKAVFVLLLTAHCSLLTC
jgi:hypothetical protein